MMSCELHPFGLGALFKLPEQGASVRFIFGFMVFDAVDELITARGVRRKRQIRLDHKTCDARAQFKSEFNAAIPRPLGEFGAINGHKKMLALGSSILNKKSNERLCLQPQALL